jgi:hypothetical protein
LGFGTILREPRFLFKYETVFSSPIAERVKNINPYLVNAKNVFIHKRSTPICNVPEMNRGSDPIDDGNLLLNESEMKTLITSDPEAKNSSGHF